MHQELLFADILKFTKKSPLNELYFFVLTKTAVMLAAYFKLLL